MTLLTEYLEPSSFYKLLVDRRAVSPILLKRNIAPINYQKRKRKRKLIVTNTNGLSGYLVACSCLVKCIGDEAFRVVEIFDKVQVKLSKGNERTQFSFSLPAKASCQLCLSISDELGASAMHLIVIANVPDLSVISHLELFIETLLTTRIKDSSHSAVHFTVIELYHFLASKQPFQSDSRQPSSLRSGFHPVPPNYVGHFSKVSLIQQLPNLLSATRDAESSLCLDVQFAFASKPSASNKVRKSASSSSTTNTIAAESTSTPPLERKVYFHYINSKNSARERSGSEHMQDVLVEEGSLSCPWCVSSGPTRPRPALFLASQDNRGYALASKASAIRLLVHLDTHHPHFAYDAMVDPLGNLHLLVQPSTMEFAGAVPGPVGPYFYSRPKSTPSSFRNDLLNLRLCYVESHDLEGRPTSGRTSLSVEGLNSLALQKRRLEHPRPYFHPRLGIPLTDREFLYCDFERDPAAWEKSASVRSLVDFEDICHEEKSFMKLWNALVTRYYTLLVP